MVSGTKCSSNSAAACLTNKVVRGDLGLLFHLANGSRPRQCLRALRERTDPDFRKVGLATAAVALAQTPCDHLKALSLPKTTIAMAESVPEGPFQAPEMPTPV